MNCVILYFHVLCTYVCMCVYVCPTCQSTHLVAIPLPLLYLSIYLRIPMTNRTTATRQARQAKNADPWRSKPGKGSAGLMYVTLQSIITSAKSGEWRERDSGVERTLLYVYQTIYRSSVGCMCTEQYLVDSRSWLSIEHVYNGPGLGTWIPGREAGGHRIPGQLH